MAEANANRQAGFYHRLSKPKTIPVGFSQRNSLSQLPRHLPTLNYSPKSRITSYKS